MGQLSLGKFFPSMKLVFLPLHWHKVFQVNCDFREQELELGEKNGARKKNRSVIRLDLKVV